MTYTRINKWRSRSWRALWIWQNKRRFKTFHSQIRWKKKKENIFLIQEPPNTSFLPYAQTYLLSFINGFYFILLRKRWATTDRWTESKQKRIQTDSATTVNHMNYVAFNYGIYKCIMSAKILENIAHIYQNRQLKSFTKYTWWNVMNLWLDVQHVCNGFKWKIHISEPHLFIVHLMRKLRPCFHTMEMRKNIKFVWNMRPCPSIVQLYCHTNDWIVLTWDAFFAVVPAPWLSSCHVFFFFLNLSI